MGNIIGKSTSERTAVLTEMLDCLFEGILFGYGFLGGKLFSKSERFK
ncbi:hypothetical protein HYT53_00525 [Candidatus Woesearchaeota archaeon]|nr:hypothetical protein [Candidatus Woesearchaeota archaeon]